MIWGLKLQDRDPANAAKDDTWAPVGVAEGPTEPKQMTGLLETLLDWFLEHDPGALDPVL